MGYPTHPYGSYHSLAQAGGMGGAMMTSHMAMMGQQQSGMMGVQQNNMIGVQQNTMMGQQNGLMGAQGVMAQPSGIVASPYMGGMTQGMMGQQQSRMMVHQQNGIMGQQQSGMIAQQQSSVTGQQQVGGLATLPHQQVYGVQQAQQLQWNIAQVCVYLFLTIWMLKIITFLSIVCFVACRRLSTWLALITTTPAAWWDTAVNTWEVQ